MSSGAARRARSGNCNYQAAARRRAIAADADAQHATSTCHTGGTRIATLSCSQVAAHQSRRRPQSGSALLAVVLLGGAVAVMSVALLGDAATLTAETRAHRDAQCARYAALGGLAAGTAASASATTALFSRTKARHASSIARPRSTSRRA